MISYYNPKQDIELRFHVVHQGLIWNKYNNIQRQFVHEIEEYVCQEHLAPYISSILDVVSIVGINIHPVAVQKTCACCDPIYPAAWNPDIPGFVRIGAFN